MFKYNTAMSDTRSTFQALIARESGSDNIALRAVLTFSYVPTKKGTLQMSTASRLSPQVRLALTYLIINLSRIESVVSVRLAKSIHQLPPVTFADSCTLVLYDNDVNPGCHYYAAE
eukprot:8971581-Pyramimonas_sp.AAC.1